MDITSRLSDPTANPEYDRALESLKAHAINVVRAYKGSDRLVQMRAYANSLGLSFDTKDDELKEYLAAAEVETAPRIEYGEGETLTSETPDFLIDGLVIEGTNNIICGQPKVGKSSLVIGMAAAMRDHRDTFLGCAIKDPSKTRPLVIFGTDQPESDWRTYLAKEGLANERGTLQAPLKFFCSIDGLERYNFTDRGVENMAEVIRRYQEPVVIIDSLASMMEATGLAEKDSSFAAPIRKALRSLAINKATLVILHHTVKRVESWDWITESRGGTSLSGVFSWGGLIRWLHVDDEAAEQLDKRVGIVCKGRLRGAQDGILAEYTDDGWVSHGDFKEAIRLQRLREKETALQGNRALVFDAVVNFHRMGKPCSVQMATDHTNIKHMSTVGRELRALQGTGLVRVAHEEKTGARPLKFYCLSIEAAELFREPWEAPGAGTAFFHKESNKAGFSVTGVEEEKSSTLYEIKSNSGKWSIKSRTGPNTYTLEQFGRSSVVKHDMRLGIDFHEILPF